MLMVVKRVRKKNVNLRLSWGKMDRNRELSF